MNREIREEIQKNILFFDGGTGSVLQGMGLKPGELPERWNRTYPERIQKLHYNYYLAGANIIKTNTFGANRLKFQPEELKELVTAAIDNAKEARRQIEEEPLPVQGIRPGQVDVADRKSVV